MTADWGIIVMVSAACRVLEDRTGDRITLYSHVVIALIVHLGPSLIKRHQLSSNAVLQARSLLLTAAQFALRAHRRCTHSTTSFVSIALSRQVHQRSRPPLRPPLRQKVVTAGGDIIVMVSAACRVLEERTLARIPYPHTVIALIVQLGPPLKRDHLVALSVAKTKSLFIPAAQFANRVHRRCTHSTTSFVSMALVRQVHQRSRPPLRQKVVTAQRDIIVSVPAACRVVEDRTGDRIILDIHVVLANLVQLGPSPTKRHQLGALSVANTTSLLLPAAQFANGAHR